MKFSQQLNHPQPLVSADVLSIPQPILTALEEAWSNHQRTRMLIPIDARQHLDVFLRCLEHLLHHAQGKPLLVLSSASAVPELTGRWQTARSIDGQPLTERFPLCSLLTLPLSEQAQLCISTVRALQLQQVQGIDQLTTLFEVIVAYDFPASFSPVWKRVIERMTARSLIVFCASPKPEVTQWCDTVIAWESGRKNRSSSAT